MAIKSDKWIKEMALNHNMIEPFQADQVKSNDNGKIVSYGTSSYGYDVRCADEFKVFTNINSTMVDPKNFDDKSFDSARRKIIVQTKIEHFKDKKVTDTVKFKCEKIEGKKF